MSLRLSKVPPLAYLTLYLLAVPSFAGVYAGPLKNGFYAPYAHLERPWLEAKDDLARYLGDALIEAIHEKEKYTARHDTDGSRTRYTDTNSVTSIQNLHIGNDQTIEFDAAVIPTPEIVGDDTGNFKEFISKPFFCHFKFESHMSSYVLLKPKTLYRLAQMKYLPEETCKKKTIEQLFFVMNDGAIRLPIHPQKAYEAISLTEGLSGAPSSVGGNFWRMLYLSVVVITTLGLGDILPISPIARGFVGAEAFLGVVLAGLFLNAVAWSAAHPEPD